MSNNKQVYSNIYPFYESARQARIERKELRKSKKAENNLKRNKIREDCLKRAVVTEGVELEALLVKNKLSKILDYILKKAGFNH